MCGAIGSAAASLRRFGLGPSTETRGDGPAQTAFWRVINEKAVARLMHYRHAHRQCCKDQAYKVLTLPHRLLRLFALGNIHVRSICANGFSPLVANDSGAAEEHMDAAIGPYNAKLNVARPSFEKLGVAAQHKF